MIHLTPLITAQVTGRIAESEGAGLQGSVITKGLHIRFCADTCTFTRTIVFPFDLTVPTALAR